MTATNDVRTFSGSTHKAVVRKKDNGVQRRPKTCNSVANNFDDNWVEDENGCWVWQRAIANKRWPDPAYAYGSLRANGKTAKAHRFSYERKYGPIPKGMHAMHTCHNPICVNPDHIEIGTNADNHLARVLIGHTTAKLTVYQVRFIRRAVPLGVSQLALAERFNVTRKCINLIVNRTTWKHVR